ncbi:MAG: hypothetical protein WD690_10090 [Vicinamibacterales bacterium]
MRKSRAEKKSAKALRAADVLPGVLLFEIDRRKLRTVLGRRVVRRRALADGQRRVLERLIKKSGTVDINELTRERLERSIRVHEEVAEFLTFAGEHLVGRRGKQRLTASELQVLDLMPRQTFD